MKKKIGIDFGTTNSTIAFFDANDTLCFFAIVPDTPSHYIPSTIFYPEERSEPVIGFQARHSEEKNVKGKRGDFYEHFKMFLPVKEDTLKSTWGRRKTPQNVARDYLERLLGEFSSQHGKIERAVCSVPELWQRDLGSKANLLDANFGTEQLRKIITDKLGLKSAQLCSEPVCAAAYYAYTKSREGEAFKGNLLVCDPGGGTFDVSLCSVTETHIEVLTFEGHGYRGLDSAGVAFDRNIIKEVCRASGISIDESSRDFRLMQWEFEEEKKLELNNEAIEKVWQEVRDKNKNMDSSDNPFWDDGVYELVFKDKEFMVTYGQVINAFRPIKQGIEETLGKIKEWCDIHRKQIDRVIIVGGFGRFPLVQLAILDALSLGREALDEQFNRNRQVIHSVAAGAAVIANEKYQVVEKYPHSIGLDAKQIKDGLLTNVEMEIIKASEYTLNSGIVWASQPGKESELIEIEIDRKGLKLDIWIKKNGVNKMYLEIADRTPEAGNYHLGAAVEQNYRAALILKNIKQGKTTSIQLGDVSIPILIK